MKSLLRRVIRGRPIIVVSGLPRTGTSMAMQMLEAGGVPILTDGLRTADENNPGGYFELERVKTLAAGGDTGWLASARGKAAKIISPLLTYLPESYEYQVVFMRRDLDEVVASQNAMLNARQQPRGAPDERMRAHYEQHLRQVERFLERRACFATLMVHYAEVLANPREQSARIDAFLGGGLDLSRMATVADSTLYRRRHSAPRR
jgi:hypothetical protein